MARERNKKLEAQIEKEKSEKLLLKDKNKVIHDKTQIVLYKRN